MEPVTLRTARLTLSIPRGLDADAIYEACQDADIQRFTTVPSPYTHDDAATFPIRAAAGWSADTETTWALRREEALVGMIGLYRIRAREAELGYWLSPGHRGAGFMTEAAEAVADWAFTGPLALRRLEWRAAVGNTGSARIAQRVGFRFGGMLRRAVTNGFGVHHDAWIADLLPADLGVPVPWLPPEAPVLDGPHADGEHPSATSPPMAG